MWYGTSEKIAESTLQNTTRAYSEKELIQTADPVNVSLRGVNVPDTYGFFEGETNDLMIVAKFQFDDQPPINRLLYLKNDVEPGWFDDLFDDVILTTNDFSYDELNIHLQVYDIDKIDPQLAESVSKLVEEAASIVTNPLLSQFAGFVDFAAEPLIDLVNYINEHDRIIDDKIKLEVDEEPRRGHDLLQPGYLVCFEREADVNVSQDAYRLDDDLKVVGPNDSVHTESSYAVLEVERKHVQTGSKEINQKVAKLVAELEGQGQSDQAAVEYLRQTLKGYNKYKKVNRAADLSSKESLTESEKKLLDRLESDIGDLLSASQQIMGDDI